MLSNDVGHRLHELESRLAGERLPAAFHALVPLLHAESDGVRFASEQALRRLLLVCFTDELTEASVTHLASSRSGAPPAVAAVMGAVCGALGSSTPQAWSSALSGEGDFERSLTDRSRPASEQEKQPVKAVSFLHGVKRKNEFFVDGASDA